MSAEGEPSGNPMHLTIHTDPHAPVDNRCGATTRAGGSCKNPMGFKTDHFGQGRCYLHGGVSGRVTHGRYSKIKRPRIAELVKAFEADPDPTNLLSDLALLRALTMDFIERYDETTEALLAWHSSFGRQDRPQKPQQVMDLADAGGLLDKVGKMVDRIEKQATDVTQHPEFWRITREMGRHVIANVPDDEARQRILAGWRSIVRPGAKE